jgi:N-acetylmuramoyl-L-alanine amidase
VRGAIVLLAGLALAAPATAAPPSLTAVASPAAGVAPLRVTLTASGDATSYAWDLGDGATTGGAVVQHVYRAGRYTATVTATGATGEVAQTQVQVVASSRTLTLSGPGGGDYGGRATLAGALLPAVNGARVQIYRGGTHVTSARVGPKGRFRVRILLRSPGPYHARFGALRSQPRTIVLRPALDAALPAVTSLGGALSVNPVLVPAGAGTVRVRVFRNGRLVQRRAGRLSSGTAGSIRVELTTAPRRGYAAVRRTLRAQVVLPTLAAGARGSSVLALEQRLAQLHYALRGVDGVYDQDTTEAVLAFQKVNGLPRTGRVETWLWRRLARAGIPRSLRGGDYIEVDKTRQVLFVVEAGVVARVVHVSTGATGNTPLGSWHVYRTVPGWDWVLWYPLYFKGGFAIHGYPSVPAYPASHGCVRIPMWIAPSLYGAHGRGTAVVVHL